MQLQARTNERDNPDEFQIRDRGNNQTDWMSRELHRFPTDINHREACVRLVQRSDSRWLDKTPVVFFYNLPLIVANKHLSNEDDEDSS